MTSRRTFAQVRYAPPEGAAEIVLVRHGETVAHDPERPFGLLAGQGDPALGPTGWDQAERLADRLGATRVDAIYVTTLRRTAETARPLAERLGVEPTVEPDLREVLLGEWEGGIYRQKMLERDPLAVEMLARRRWDVVPGAESNEAFAARLRRGIGRIARAHRDERVVAVSHGGAIGMIVAIASSAQPFAFLGVDNGSISTVVVSKGAWTVRSYNDTCHLA